jgi:hypothetical protein
MPTIDLITEECAEFARSVVLSFGSNPRVDPHENMIAFSMSPLVEASPESLEALIERVLSAYRDKVESAGEFGVFYVWLDAQVAELRFSFFRTRGALPFAAPLEIWSSSRDFSARLALQIRETRELFSMGIERVDTRDSFDDDDEAEMDEVDDGWKLDVFAIEIGEYVPAT